MAEAGAEQGPGQGDVLGREEHLGQLDPVPAEPVGGAAGQLVGDLDRDARLDLGGQTAAAAPGTGAATIAPTSRSPARATNTPAGSSSPRSIRSSPTATRATRDSGSWCRNASRRAAVSSSG